MENVPLALIYMMLYAVSQRDGLMQIGCLVETVSYLGTWHHKQSSNIVLADKKINGKFEGTYQQQPIIRYRGTSESSEAEGFKQELGGKL